MYKAEIICDSINVFGVRATTIAVTYPRIILAELNTHRMHSKSTSSSRAIPIKTMIKQVWSNPFMPVHWGKNKPGMQAKEELSGFKLVLAKGVWLLSSKVACLAALTLSGLGLHKQISNRILEPWMWTTTLITATEWDNFFKLRNHKDAQPEIQKLAQLMQLAMDSSTPTKLAYGEWHLPYIMDYEQDRYPIKDLLKLSTARCARISYFTHGTRSININNDLELHDQLVGSEPKHASPTEHQLTPGYTSGFYYNVRSWKSYRYCADNKQIVCDRSN